MRTPAAAKTPTHRGWNFSDKFDMRHTVVGRNLRPISVNSVSCKRRRAIEHTASHSPTRCRYRRVRSRASTARCAACRTRPAAPCMPRAALNCALSEHSQTRATRRPAPPRLAPWDSGPLLTNFLIRTNQTSKLLSSPHSAPPNADCAGAFLEH